MSFKAISTVVSDDEAAYAYKIALAEIREASDTASTTKESPLLAIHKANVIIAAADAVYDLTVNVIVNNYHTFLTTGAFPIKPRVEIG